MRLADDAPKTAAEVIDRFNRAFQERDATLLEDIVNVMRVVDGMIVEAAGYSKTAPTVTALESRPTDDHRQS
jgi:hypothetical protein